MNNYKLTVGSYTVIVDVGNKPELSLEQIIEWMIEVYMEDRYDDTEEGLDKTIIGILEHENTKDSWKVEGSGKVSISIERYYFGEVSDITVLQNNFDHAGEHPEQVQLEDVISEKTEA